MSSGHLDRHAIRMKPLASRRNRVIIERDHVPVGAAPENLTEVARAVIDECAERLRLAKENGKARMLTFGAHAIKNGLAPVIAELARKGWFTHLATNGAGIIHDWEFAYLGESSEHVRENVATGEFGAWEETGRYLNLALAVGAFEGLGYGESIGAFVENEGLDIPSETELLECIGASLPGHPEKAAAAADLLDVIRAANLEPGRLRVPHPHKRFGLQAAAYRMKTPFTGHPMIGHDILYIHPLNRCAAIGRAAQRDFLSFANEVSRLDGGVYLSIGSAIMSPMVFEKSMAMAQNLARQRGNPIENHFIAVVDLAKSHWDWTLGEPPEDNPDYYLRYNKTFSRMGGTMRYLSADNRDFLLALLQRIEP